MKESAPTLAIVIPVYNEAESLGRMAEELETVACRTGITFEIIFVDDGSDDRGPEILAQMDGYTIVRHGRNRGYGAALKTGFDRARGAEYIAFLDADSTYPPQALLPLLDHLREDKTVTMCIGSRMGSNPNEMEFLRRLGNRLYADLCGVLFGSNLSDVCSGLRIFRTTLFDQIRWSDLSDDLDFSPQLTSRCLKCGVQVVELPIAYRERSGHSKLKIFYHGWRFLGSIVRERFFGDGPFQPTPPDTQG